MNTPLRREEVFKHFVSFKSQEAFVQFMEDPEFRGVLEDAVEAFPEVDANGDPYFHAEFHTDEPLSDEEIRNLNRSPHVLVAVCNEERSIR